MFNPSRWNKLIVTVIIVIIIIKHLEKIVIHESPTICC